VNGEAASMTKPERYALFVSVLALSGWDIPKPGCTCIFELFVLSYFELQIHCEGWIGKLDEKYACSHA
jgi:hypothetical protein